MKQVLVMLLINYLMEGGNTMLVNILLFSAGLVCGAMTLLVVSTIIGNKSNKASTKIFMEQKAIRDSVLADHYQRIRELEQTERDYIKKVDDLIAERNRWNKAYKDSENALHCLRESLTRIAS